MRRRLLNDDWFVRPKVSKFAEMQASGVDLDIDVGAFF